MLLGRLSIQPTNQQTNFNGLCSSRGKRPKEKANALETHFHAKVCVMPVPFDMCNRFHAPCKRHDSQAVNLRTMGLD